MEASGAQRQIEGGPLSRTQDAVEVPLQDSIEALREGRPIVDDRLEVLRRYVTAVIRTRGWPSTEHQAVFKTAGYTTQQMLEVLVGVAMKTLSNYVNHLADTPLDDQFATLAWEPAPSVGVNR